MTLVQNNFDGGTQGTGITQGSGGNSGGTSGDFFTNITPGTGGTFNFDSTGAYSGLGGRQVCATSTWRHYHQFTAASQVAGRVVFTINTSVPAANITLVSAVGSTTFAAVFRCGINASQKGVVQDASGATLATTAAVFTAGTAYVIEYQVFSGTTGSGSSGNGTINAQLYAASSPGTLLINFSSSAANAGGATDTAISRGQLGINSSVTTLDVTFDAIAYNTGTLTAVGPPALSPAAAVAASTGVPPSDTGDAVNIGMTIRGS